MSLRLMLITQCNRDLHSLCMDGENSSLTDVVFYCINRLLEYNNLIGCYVPIYPAINIQNLIQLVLCDLTLIRYRTRTIKSPNIGLVKRIKRALLCSTLCPFHL